jgi:hypothetical protein
LSSFPRETPNLLILSPDAVERLLLGSRPVSENGPPPRWPAARRAMRRPNAPTALIIDGAADGYALADAVMTSRRD